MTKATYRQDNLTPQEAWQAALGELELQLAKPTFDVWLKSTHVVAYEDGVFTIAAQSSFAREWLENRLKGLIKRTLTRIMGRQVDVHFIVQPRAEQYPDIQLLNGYAPTQSPVQERTNGHSCTLNPRYIFDTFIVGNSNRLPYEVCRAIAERPAMTYNPLFLYGGVGLGKTHLLHAIGNHVIQKGLSVLYVSSEQFTNDLINAIRARTTEGFRERYRSTDVLLIDDIQFIAGKESTQEEFFHTFNSLHAADRQIVLSSDRPPKAISTLEGRLRSRFQGGLIADIQPPDYETRVAILRAKADSKDSIIHDAVLEFIARQVQDNIRELEGSLNRVMAYSATLKQPITLEMTQHVLKDLITRKGHVSPEAIISAVAAYFGISMDDMTGTSRKKEVSLPRQIAMYLLCESTDLSLPQAGILLGNRDHTTILHGRDKIRELVETDVTLRRHILAIKEDIYQPVPAR